MVVINFLSIITFTKDIKESNENFDVIKNEEIVDQFLLNEPTYDEYPEEEEFIADILQNNTSMDLMVNLTGKGEIHFD